ncbi:MAG TPA: DUF1801 domain-containing protein [Solirubrobacteraceae bacterium]|nr:DUF1801 domain-containing protein [Solirubrobacteraceae bacterium]
MASNETDASRLIDDRVRALDALKDPSRLFNSSLDGKVRRAIDIKENDKIDAGALKDLIREAVALNLESR